MNYMKEKCLTLASILLMITGVYGQDSIKVESAISIETKGTGLLKTSKGNVECITCLLENIQDNPFYHFAIYSGITHKLSINESHYIETGIFLEERSFSGGSNTIDNWVVYPKILLTGKDTFEILNRSIAYKLSGGDFWNEDFDDMLRIHNLDFQGVVGELGFKGYTIGFLLIGDLSKNIGLGLHQYHKFYVKKELNRLRTTFYLSENQLTDDDQHLVPEDYNIGNNTKFKLSEILELESQLEFRINQEIKTSFAGGIGIEGQVKNLRFASRLKYYQSNFNLGYISNEVSYRGSSSYVGEQLYPLKNYYRTYSQWGNYTKSQNVDLLGFELNAAWEKKIGKRLTFFTDIDLNIIGNPKTQTGNTIPLYSLGIKTNYFKFLRTEFFFTNKHMNLDTFYQTFQASKRPFFGGSVILEMERIHLKRRTLLNMI
ncbi:MAG: hypothetical protein MI974_25640 [Chitinophagales bacterium]|nr:hypothetical protein [Chitinophagales bacterium]